MREQESRATDALVEGVGDAARVRGRLKAITAERLTLSEQRDALLAESSHSAALGAYREQLQALPYLATDAQIDAVLANGYSAWDALTMNDQRAIIRGGYRVSIRKGGRGHERVIVSAK